MRPTVPDDTIAAIATPAGQGAIGIVRLSGPAAVKIVAQLIKGPDPLSLASHTAALAWFVDRDELIDEVLCLVMRAPRSYTGEDVVELHCHGGSAVLSRVLAAVIKKGARPAGPGEFTRRAFLHGRIDLARAEAVAELIAGETEDAARQAARRLAGGLSNRLAETRAALLSLLSRLEAGIDFAEEEDVTLVGREELAATLVAIGDDLASLLGTARRGRLLQEGVTVVIAGLPNVGKSTLMNRLLGRDRVIVTPSAGTTRDVVEDRMEVGGVLLRLRDTAGIRDGVDEAERIGVEMARTAVADADLVLFMIDASSPLGPGDRALAEDLAGPAFVVLNKSDLAAAVTADDVASLDPEAPVYSISALTGEGVPELIEGLAGFVGGNDRSDSLVSNARQEDALRRARESVDRALASAEGGWSEEFAARDLRDALDAMGEITGETATDDILDLIFQRFCVGK